MTAPGSVEMGDRLRRVLERESKGEPERLRVLIAESAARRWLAARGVPAWRNPLAPGSRGRYGLITLGGTRLLTAPLPGTAASFDEMAEARCSFLLVVELDDGLRSGAPAGYARLADLRALGDPERRAPADSLILRPARDLPGELGIPRHFRLSFVAGTLRLLLLGDPSPPPPPLLGVSYKNPQIREDAGKQQTG